MAPMLLLLLLILGFCLTSPFSAWTTGKAEFPNGPKKTVGTVNSTIVDRLDAIPDTHSTISKH